MNTPSHSKIKTEAHPMLVESFHGLTTPSRLVLVDMLDAALSPIIPTLDLACAFARDKWSIYQSATLRLLAIIEGREHRPAANFAPLKRAKWGRGFRRCLDDASKRTAEDAIVCALMPFVTTKEVARAVIYDDFLIVDVTSRIGRRLRDAAKVARRG
jgi:hypothetical protein